jgi:hypothetical protein
MTIRAMDLLFGQVVHVKDLVRDAARRGDMTDDNAAQAHSAVARLILALQGGSHRPAAIESGPLSEFFRWPCASSPCPKCGSRKFGGIAWMPETPAAPERVKHKCACGYGIYTKPLDASPSASWAQSSWDDEEIVTVPVREAASSEDR